MNRGGDYPIYINESNREEENSIDINPPLIGTISRDKLSCHSIIEYSGLIAGATGYVFAIKLGYDFGKTLSPELAYVFAIVSPIPLTILSAKTSKKVLGSLSESCRNRDSVSLKKILKKLCVYGTGAMAAVPYAYLSYQFLYPPIKMASLLIIIPSFISTAILRGYFFEEFVNKVWGYLKNPISCSKPNITACFGYLGSIIGVISCYGLFPTASNASTAFLDWIDLDNKTSELAINIILFAGMGVCVTPLAIKGAYYSFSKFPSLFEKCCYQSSSSSSENLSSEIPPSSNGINFIFKGLGLAIALSSAIPIGELNMQTTNINTWYGAIIVVCGFLGPFATNFWPIGELIDSLRKTETPELPQRDLAQVAYTDDGDSQIASVSDYEATPPSRWYCFFKSKNSHLDYNEMVDDHPVTPGGRRSNCPCTIL